RLSDMICELLEFTRGSSSSVALAPVDYRRFVERLLGDLEKEAAERSVQIVYENRPPKISLPLDRRRLAHVFTNLIKNMREPPSIQWQRNLRRPIFVHDLDGSLR